MTDKLIVRAIYEDGVLKPLVPLELPDKEIVEFEIEVKSKERKIAEFEGALAPYWDKDGPTVEEIEETLRNERVKSFERLLRQINGDFEEDDINLE